MSKAIFYYKYSAHFTIVFSLFYHPKANPSKVNYGLVDYASMWSRMVLLEKVDYASM